ncbi:hypothetical protein B0H19DRAFT_1019031, partial [Mycena capillaripes]
MAESVLSCPSCNTILNPSDCLPRFDTTLVLSSAILRNNDPPVESEILQLRGFIFRGHTRMSVLDARIALIRASIDKIIQEKGELNVEIRKHEGGLSPLRRMPVEILSLIFSFTLPPHQKDTAPAPWTISAVCARWREIVISHPSLW